MIITLYYLLLLPSLFHWKIIIYSTITPLRRPRMFSYLIRSSPSYHPSFIGHRIRLILIDHRYSSRKSTRICFSWGNRLRKRAFLCLASSKAEETEDLSIFWTYFIRRKVLIVSNVDSIVTGKDSYWLR